MSDSALPMRPLLSEARLTRLGVVFTFVLSLGFGVASIVATACGWKTGAAAGAVAAVVTFLVVYAALRSRRWNDRLVRFAEKLSPPR